MPRVISERAPGTSSGSGAVVDEVSECTAVLVGVRLPARSSPSFDPALERARRRLEELVVDDATGAADATRACAVLLRVDAIQRERSRLRLPEVAEYDAFRALADRLAGMPLADLLSSGASEVCAAMGFPRALYSSVTPSMWTPRTLHLEPASDVDVDAVRTFVTDASWPLASAPVESQVVRRRSATLVRRAQEDRRTFRPLMDVTGSRSYVVAPVRARGRVVGLLHGDRSADGVDRDDLGRLEAYAQSLGVAVEHAVLRRRVTLLASRTAEMLEQAAQELRGFDGDSCALVDHLPRARPRRDGGRAERTARQPDTAPARLALLSPREFDVLTEMAHGLGNATIAGRLCLTEGTVKSHVGNVLRKLGVHSRVAAAAVLARHETGRGGEP